jgi:hypothetical protein
MKNLRERGQFFVGVSNRRSLQRSSTFFPCISIALGTTEHTSPKITHRPTFFVN